MFGLVIVLIKVSLHSYESLHSEFQTNLFHHHPDIFKLCIRPPNNKPKEKKDRKANINQ